MSYVLQDQRGNWRGNFSRYVDAFNARLRGEIVVETDAAVDWSHKYGQALQQGSAIRERLWTPEEIREAVEYNKTVDPRDPRRLLPGMDPKFRDHNCVRCRSGEKPCVRGNPGTCEWPHARND